MPNSPAVQRAMDATFKKMMAWPRWYLRFQMWRHRNGDIANALRDLWAFGDSSELRDVMGVAEK